MSTMEQVEVGKYQPYPEYKDSGVEWLGLVPKHWDVCGFKRHILRNDGGVWGDEPSGVDDTMVLRSTEQTVDGRWIIEQPAFRQLSQSEKVSALLIENDLVITKSSGSANHIGKTTLVTSKLAALQCCYSNFMQRVRTHSSFLPKLAWYVMNNRIAREQFNVASNSTIGLANLNGGMIGQLMVVVPPIAEQQTIVAFLDYETARIDKLIAQQQRLIELLKEKRQAVISHAVTKGLNPNAPMKDSGVEWLGEVPEHWVVTLLRYFITTRKGVAFKAQDFCDDGVAVVKASDIKEFSFKGASTSLPTIFLSEYPKAILRSGNIVLSTVGSTPDVKNSAVGQLGMLPEELDGALLNQNTVVFEANSIMCDNDFLFLILQTQGYRDHLDLHAHGTANQASLNVTDMLNFSLPLPPLKEQRCIVDLVRGKLDKLNRLEQLGIEAQKKYQERRTTLISAAVTGKIDLRGWTAPVQEGAA